MNELNVLKRFLSFPISSTEEIFEEFKTIKGHVFSEESNKGKKRFLYVEGRSENKVILVAHADTYFDIVYGYSKKTNILLDEGDIWRAVDENGKPQLLGADDRAGLAMLWLLKDSGHSLLVTDGEERGRVGSTYLMNENFDISNAINLKHQFMIQLDRRNDRDYKCYDVGTYEFRNFIETQTDFSEPNRSSYTDICTLCRDICGVNFSIGYMNEHGVNETLNISQWLNTYDILTKLLSKEYLPKFSL